MFQLYQPSLFGSASLIGPVNLIASASQIGPTNEIGTATSGISVIYNLPTIKLTEPVQPVSQNEPAQSTESGEPIIQLSQFSPPLTMPISGQADFQSSGRFQTLGTPHPL